MKKTCSHLERPIFRVFLQRCVIVLSSDQSRHVVDRAARVSVKLPFGVEAGETLAVFGKSDKRWRWNPAVILKKIRFIRSTEIINCTQFIYNKRMITFTSYLLLLCQCQCLVYVRIV